MSTYQNILVVLDPTVDKQKALNRAVELARLQGGKLTAFVSVYDFSYEMTTMLSAEERELMRRCMVEERTQWLEDVLEPFLIQQGFIQRTPRGRIATARAYKHFDLIKPD